MNGFFVCLSASCSLSSSVRFLAISSRRRCNCAGGGGGEQTIRRVRWDLHPRRRHFLRGPPPLRGMEFAKSSHGHCKKNLPCAEKWANLWTPSSDALFKCGTSSPLERGGGSRGSKRRKISPLKTLFLLLLLVSFEHPISIAFSPSFLQR